MESERAMGYFFVIPPPKSLVDVGVIFCLDVVAHTPMVSAPFIWYYAADLQH